MLVNNQVVYIVCVNLLFTTSIKVLRKTISPNHLFEYDYFIALHGGSLLKIIIINFNKTPNNFFFFFVRYLKGDGDMDPKL